MAVQAEVLCSGVSGSATSFVTHVRVSVDGQVVATRDGDLSSFVIPLDLHGAHTVVVEDRTAGNDYDTEHGGTEHGGDVWYVVASETVACPERAPETTTTAPTVSEPLASVPQLVIEPPVVQQEPTTTYVALDLAPVDTTWGPCFEDGSCLTTATVQVPTGDTLPATGAATGPLVGMGSGALMAGAVFVWFARRPRRV